MKRLPDHAIASAMLPLLAAAATPLLSGCNVGPALLRVVEINLESSSGGSSYRSSVEIAYTPEGRVDEMERTTEGDFVARHEHSYEDGRLVAIEVLQDGSPSRTLDLEWSGNLLTEMSASYDDTTEEYELQYVDADASALSTMHSEVNNGGYISREEIAFEYDDRRRLVEMRSESTSEVAGQAFPATTTEWQTEYGDDGRPSSVELTSRSDGSTSMWEADLGYDDQGRLEEIDFDDGTDVSLSYDDQGRVQEVEQRAGNTTTTVEYVYEDGYTDGFAFLLSGTTGFFDLGGRPLERPHVYSTSMIPTP